MKTTKTLLKLDAEDFDGKFYATAADAICGALLGAYQHETDPNLFYINGVKYIFKSAEHCNGVFYSAILKKLA